MLELSLRCSDQGTDLRNGTRFAIVKQTSNFSARQNVKVEKGKQF